MKKIFLLPLILILIPLTACNKSQSGISINDKLDSMERTIAEMAIQLADQNVKLNDIQEKLNALN